MKTEQRLEGCLGHPELGGGKKALSLGLPEGAQPCPAPIAALRPLRQREEVRLRSDAAQLAGTPSGFLGEEGAGPENLFLPAGGAQKPACLP